MVVVGSGFCFIENHTLYIFCPLVGWQRYHIDDMLFASAAWYFFLILFIQIPQNMCDYLLAENTIWFRVCVCVCYLLRLYSR